MKLLLDQGLPRSAVSSLLRVGIESIHVGDKGLAKASDAKILDFAREGGWVVVTLDADFHVLLVLSGASGPSVVRVRIEGQRSEELASLLVKVAEICFVRTILSTVRWCQ